MNFKRFLAILAGSLGILSAQAANPTLSIVQVGTGAAYPGATIQMAMVLGGSAGFNIAALQMTYWPGVNGLAAGVASTVAQKSLNCNATTAICLLIGDNGTTLSNATYADGQVLTFSYTIPSTAAIGSTITAGIPAPTFASSNTGATVAVTLVPLTLTVVLNPACISTLGTMLSAFETAPTQTGLNAIEAKLIEINTTGACQ